MADGSSIPRRVALGAMAAAGLGFAAWPYRPRSRRDVPAGRTVVTYWEKWTGAEGEAVQRAVDRFNEEQSAIWVHRVPVSDIIPKAMVAIGGGDAPDLVGLFNFNVPLFAEAGAILPLDELLAGAPIGSGHYAPAVWRMLTHEGRWWAGITTCHTMALYVNRTLLADAGLDPDRPPATVAELDAAARRLTRATPDGPLERAGFLPNIPNWWPYLWPALFGGRLYDAEHDRATITDPANVAAYEWIAAYPRAYGRQATTAFAAGFGRTFNSTQDPFMSQRVAMIVQGPWIANFIRRHAPELDYGCVPVPVAADLAGGPPTGMLEADVLVVPRGGRNPEAAGEFLLSMQRPDVHERLATEHCKGSALRDVSPAFRARHPNPFVAVHDAVCHSPRAMVAPQTRVWPQYARLVQYAFDAIWSGADVRAELETTRARAQELLDVAAGRRQRGGLAGATS